MRGKAKRERYGKAEYSGLFSGSWPQHFQNQITNKNSRYSGKLSLPLFLPRPEVQAHLINCKKAVSFYD